MSSDRVSNLASASGVGLAIVGTAVHDVALSILGPLVALAVHCFTQWRADSRRRNADELVDHLKLENYRLTCELAKARAIQPGPPNQ